MLEPWKPAHSRAKRLAKTMTGIRALIARIRFSGRVPGSQAASKMSRVRRMKITVESERVLVVVHQKSAQGWCPNCNSNVSMVGLDEAIAIADVSRGTILRQIEERRLHFSETTPAELLICLNSLMKEMRNRD
jgi:hypothetical protein